MADGLKRGHRRAACPTRWPALTFVRKGRLEWRESPRPVCTGSREALVRPIVASRCDGDCLFLFHDYSRALQLGAALHVIDPEVRELGDRPFAGPFAYGHECVAEVMDVGDAVRGVRDRPAVVVPWAISCGACGTCRRGLTSQCERKTTALAAYGFGGRAGGWGGMVSDVLRVPFADGMLVPVPAGLSPLAPLAGASDNLPDAWRTVAPAPARRAGRAGAGRRRRRAQHRPLRRRHRRRARIVARRLRRRRPRQPGDRGGARRQPDRAAAAGALAGAAAPPLAARYPITVDASNREAGLELRHPRRWRPAASARRSASTSGPARRCRSGTCT